MTVNRPIRIPKPPVKRSIPNKPAQHQMPGSPFVPTVHAPPPGARITEHAWFLSSMRQLRDRDRLETVLYTGASNPVHYLGAEFWLYVGVTKGSELAKAGGEVTAVQMIGDLVRWTFPTDADALMFKLKFGAEVVPPPWREFFPALPGESE